MDTVNSSNTSDLTQCQDIKAYISDNNIDCSNATEYNKRSVELGTRGGMNILGIIVFTVAFAITLGRLGEEGQKVVKSIGVLNEAIMKLVTLVMWYVILSVSSPPLPPFLYISPLSLNRPSDILSSILLLHFTIHYYTSYNIQHSPQYT